MSNLDEDENSQQTVSICVMFGYGSGAAHLVETDHTVESWRKLTAAERDSIGFQLARETLFENLDWDARDEFGYEVKNG